MAEPRFDFSGVDSLDGASNDDDGDDDGQSQSVKRAKLLSTESEKRLHRRFLRWLSKHHSWLSEKYKHLIGRTVRRQHCADRDRPEHFKIIDIHFSTSVDIVINYWKGVECFVNSSFVLTVRHPNLNIDDLPWFPISKSVTEMGELMVDCSLKLSNNVSIDMLDRLFQSHQNTGIPKPLIGIICEYSQEWITSNEWTLLSSWFGYTPLDEQRTTCISTHQSDTLLKSTLLSTAIP
jgi:hypothetical protein